MATVYSICIGGGGGIAMTTIHYRSSLAPVLQTDGMHGLYAYIMYVYQIRSTLGQFTSTDNHFDVQSIYKEQYTKIAKSMFPWQPKCTVLPR